jgi:surface polysaccharide O-acyltransferase-like enzyme
MNNATRILSADLLKTVSIAGVVFIHGATTFGCNSEFSKTMSNLFRFAVPCFFIMWAFFFEKSYSNKTKEQRKIYLKHRFIHDFTVYFMLYMLYLDIFRIYCLKLF